MKRHYIIASHSTLSAGMADVLHFFAGSTNNLDINVITAYVDNKPIDEEIKDIFAGVALEDEVIVLTDIMAGSVNQKLFPYISRQHTHILTGMNLPLALALVMEPSKDYLTEERVQQLVDESRTQLAYMNTINQDSEDEEDE